MSSELRAHTVPKGGPVAGLVAAGRRFDLDHVGAHVAHHHRAEGSGQCASEVYDLDTVQSCIHFVPPRGLVSLVYPASSNAWEIIAWAQYPPLKVSLTH